MKERYSELREELYDKYPADVAAMTQDKHYDEFCH